MEAVLLVGGSTVQCSAKHPGEYELVDRDQENLQHKPHTLNSVYIKCTASCDKTQSQRGNVGRGGGVNLVIGDIDVCILAAEYNVEQNI